MAETTPHLDQRAHERAQKAIARASVNQFLCSVAIDVEGRSPAAGLVLREAADIFNIKAWALEKRLLDREN